jgi:periplasmic protein CpxP/Spy
MRHREARLPLIATLMLVALVVQAMPQSPADQPDKQEAMAKLQKISAELQLTPEQKQKMLPILIEEGSKMKAVKANTSLAPMQKMMQMRQVGTEMDAKMKPILSPPQYEKYEQIRTQERQEMIEKMRAGKQQ